MSFTNSRRRKKSKTQRYFPLNVVTSLAASRLCYKLRKNFGLELNFMPRRTFQSRKWTFKLLIKENGKKFNICESFDENV